MFNSIHFELQKREQTCSLSIFADDKIAEMQQPDSFACHPAFCKCVKRNVLQKLDPQC